MKLKYQYKNRFYLLLGGILLLMIISYKLAFSMTFSEKKILKEYSSQLTSVDEAPLQLQFLEYRLKEYDTLLSPLVYDPEEYQVHLLDRASVVSKETSVKIVEIPIMNIETTDEFLIKTQQLIFQGSFNNLLKLLDKLSKDHNIGNICSVDFQNKKDNKTGMTYLKMKVYFQLLTENKKR